MDFGNVDFQEPSRAGGCRHGGSQGSTVDVRNTLKPLVRMWRGTRKGLWVLLALSATLGPVQAAASRDRYSERSATATVAPPSAAPFIGVGGLSLIGILALRRRGRGSQG